jgi:hypothetical protein
MFSKDAFPENKSSFEERSNFNHSKTFRWIIKVIIDDTDILEERSTFPKLVVAARGRLDCMYTIVKMEHMADKG